MLSLSKNSKKSSFGLGLKKTASNEPVNLSVTEDFRFSDFFNSCILDETPWIFHPLKEDEVVATDQDKSVGFGLNKKAKEPEEKPAKKDNQPEEDQPLSRRSLSISNTPSSVSKILSRWFSEQINIYLERSAFSVFAECFTIKDGEEISIPLLQIPVWLHPAKSKVPFSVKGIYAEYKYHPSALRLFEKYEVTPPVLPKILEDLNPQTFKEDLEELLIPLQNLQLEESCLICQHKPIRQPFIGESDYTFSELPGWGDKDSKETWNHIIDSGYIPKSFDYGQLELISHGLNGHSFRIEGEDTRSDLKLAASLAMLLAYQDKKILVIGDRNVQLDSLKYQIEQTINASICLPLHQAQTRRQLTQLLQKTVDQPLNQQKTKPVDTQKLRKILNNLAKYEKAWLLPFGALEMSPAELSDKFESLRMYTDIPIAVPDASTISNEDIEKWKQSLLKYLDAYKKIGNPDEHPWRYSNISEFPEEFTDKAEKKLEHIQDLLGQCRDLIERICKLSGAQPPETFNDVRIFIRLLTLLIKSPPTDGAQLKQQWDPVPPEVQTALKLIKEGQLMLKEISMYFHTEIIQEDLEELVPQLTKYRGKVSRFFNWNFQKNMERLLNYGRNDNVVENSMFWHNLEKSLDIKKVRNRINKVDNEVKLYFGDDWNGLNTNLDYVEKKIKWLKEFSKNSKRFPWLVSDETITFILGAKGKVEARLETLQDLYAKVEVAFTDLRNLLKLEQKDPLYFYNSQTFKTLQQNIFERIETLPLLNEWVEFQSLDQSVSEPFVQEFLEKVQKRKDVAVEHYPQVFERLIYTHILRAARADRPALDVLTVDKIEKLLEFVARYISRLNENATPMFQEFLAQKKNAVSESINEDSSQDILRHELRKHARRNPISQTLEKTFSLINNYSPVWLIRRDQWTSYSQYANEWDHILHIGGALPDDLPEESTIIQLGRAERIENLPAVNYSKLYPNQFPDKPKTEIYAESVPDSSLSVGKLPWQVVDKTLEIMTTDELEYPVLLHSTQSGFPEIAWRQLAEYAVSESSVSDLLSNPLKLQQNLFSGTPELSSDYAIVDVSQKAAKTSFGFKKDSSVADLPYEWMLENVKKQIWLMGNDAAVLEKTKNRFEKSPDSASSGKDNAISTSLKKLLNSPWKVIPAKSPLYAIVRHEEHDALAFCIWSEPADDEIPLWLHYYSWKDAGLKPFFVSRLHHSETTENRLEQLKRILEQEELEFYRELERNNQEIAQTETEEKENKNEASSKQKEPAVYADIYIERLLENQILDEPILFKKAGKQRKAPVLDFADLPIAKPYQLHNGVPMGNREDFLDASEKQIQKLLLEIIQMESPIHWRNLMRCFASYWQIQRLSNNVEAILFQNISALLRDKKVFTKDACLYDNENYTFKVRDRSDSLAFHRPYEVPLDECEMAIFLVLEKFHPLPKQRVYDAASHILGFSRTDKALEMQFDLALARMANQETVLEGQYGLQLQPSLYKSSVKLPDSPSQ